jgi:hypothetical protein
VAVVCDKYPESQTSKKKTLYVQRAIGRLVDELPEEWFTPRLVDSYWAKGGLSWPATMNPQRIGLLLG